VKRSRRTFCSMTCSRTFQVGENSTSWRGGSDPNRGAGWLKLAETIRERDGYECRRCGKSQEENGRKLDVDHIRPWRSCPSVAVANDPSNLVSLCHLCHKWKTQVAERRWLKTGDSHGMAQYLRSLGISAREKASTGQVCPS
jgi:hypothetical protein